MMAESYIKQHLSRYRNKDLTKSALLSTVRAFPDLRVKYDTFVFSDNTRKDLLSLDGTIPVSFKGATYNIPICIWLFETHPFNPPICYVKPTPDMTIKASRHVDASGRVYLPYLHEWKHPNSDLIGLIQVMTIVFGENSPVYARPANQQPVMSSMQTPYSGAQPPPSQAPRGYPSPGYPGQQMPMPTPVYPTPAGYPGGGNNQYRPPTNYQYPGSTPYPQGGMPQQQPPAGYPYPTPQQSQSQYTPSPAKGTSAVSSQQSLSDDQIKISLQTAVEDKLKRRMKEVLQVYQNEMDALTATKNRLKDGQSRLEQMLDQLQEDQNKVEANTRELKQKNEEIKESLQKMEGRDELEPDEAVTPTAPLYKQLLSLVAEEMTIEDTYYYLMEALKKDVIELEVFLKHVRELSRKQYLLRAHIQKVRETAGLRTIP